MRQQDCSTISCTLIPKVADSFSEHLEDVQSQSNMAGAEHRRLARYRQTELADTLNRSNPILAAHQCSRRICSMCIRRLIRMETGLSSPLDTSVFKRKQQLALPCNDIASNPNKRGQICLQLQLGNFPKRKIHVPFQLSPLSQTMKE